MHREKLIECIEKELKRPASNTMDAMFKQMLKDDFKAGNFKTNRVWAVIKKYDLI